MLLQCVKNDRLVVWLTIKVLTFEARKISSWGNCEGLKCATWAQGNISEKGEFYKMETAYRGISFLTMDQLQKLAIEGIFKMQKRHPCPLGPAKYLIENIQSKLIVLSRSGSIQAMITVPSIFMSLWFNLNVQVTLISFHSNIEGQARKEYSSDVYNVQLLGAINKPTLLQSNPKHVQTFYNIKLPNQI